MPPLWQRPAGESLWDCEERVRLLGMAQEPDHPETLERITALRDGPMDTPDVRAGAEARLAATTTPCLPWPDLDSQEPRCLPFSRTSAADDDGED
ncbi:hypothetical protein ACFCZ1_04125 [Streptomyces sp. NPDC056224]|uniref:hypothetical protein n=1 Tax=Streptomyces sp. NPDC056224 TaxID=3345750 RepID=UPI0035D74FB9